MSCWPTPSHLAPRREILDELRLFVRNKISDAVAVTKWFCCGIDRPPASRFGGVGQALTLAALDARAAGDWLASVLFQSFGGMRGTDDLLRFQRLRLLLTYAKPAFTSEC